MVSREAVVALQPDQTGTGRGRECLGDRGLPDPRLALKKHGQLQHAGQVEHGRQRPVNNVLLLKQRCRE